MSAKKKYKHIFFDLDNTLWDFERNSIMAMNFAFKFFEIEKQDIKFDDFYQVYSKHNFKLWNEYRNNVVTKKELIRKRFQLTFTDLGILGINPEVMNSCYLEEMPKQKLLNEGVVELLQHLEKKNYCLYIITNGFKEVQIKKLENSGLSSFFKKIFISEEIKTPKPGVEIFKYAITSANAKKSESLMIGDDWDVDIMGATGFGIDSVYYNSGNSLSKKGEIEIKNRIIIYKINRLSQLADILEV